MVFALSYGCPPESGRTRLGCRVLEIQPACQSGAYQSMAGVEAAKTRLSRFSGVSLPRTHSVAPRRRIEGRGFLATLWRGGTGRRRHATIVMLSLALGLSATWASAFQADGGGTPQVESSRNQSPAPAPDALSAFADVEQWVAAMSVPEGAKHPFPAACVVLRQGGRVVGRGEKIVAPGEDASRVLADAAREAIEAARPLVEAGDASLRDLRRRELTNAFAISVELGQSVTPISPKTWRELDTTVSPALVGLAARFGERTECVFPTTMLSAGMQPSRALQAAITSASKDPAIAVPGIPESEPGAIAQRKGVVFYRVPVMQVARVKKGEGPLVLYRGRTLVEGSRVTMAEMTSAADAMAVHLTRRWSWREFGAGDAAAEPTAGDSRQSSPGQVALALIALGRYHMAHTVGDGLRVPRPDDPLPEVMEARCRIAEALAAKVDAAGTWSLEDAALVSIALHEQGMCVGRANISAKVEALRARVDARVAGAVADPSGTFAADVPSGSRGVVAYAIALIAVDAKNKSATPESVSFDRERGLLRSIYRDTPPDELWKQMPWVLWAEQRLAGLGTIGAAAALRDVRDKIATLEAKLDQLGDENRDMAGGLLATVGFPYPTWHGVMPAATLAAMIDDGRLTGPEEQAKHLSVLLRSVRFALQLGTDASLAVSYMQPEIAIGGVRACVWDLRQPIDATSAALIEVSETMRAMQVMADPVRARKAR